MMAPLLNVLLGLWLFVSAFALPRTIGQFALTAVIGVAVAVAGVVSIYTRAARYVSLGLATLLFFVTVMGDGSRGPVWHNVVIAAMIMVGAALGDRHLPQGSEQTLANA
jgi:hypothetical protein